jgi:hypothetical protein
MLSRPVGPVLLGALTHEWWNRRRSSFEVVVSELVHIWSARMAILLPPLCTPDELMGEDSNVDAS